MSDTLSSTFNLNLAEGAKSTFVRISDYEVVENTPVADGGSLVRVYNFASDRNQVDGLYIKGKDVKILGTKDMSNMDEKSVSDAKQVWSNNAAAL